MKTIIATLALLLCSSSIVQGQEVEMVIRMNDQTTIRLNVDSIANMKGTDVPAPYSRVVEYEAGWPERGSSGVLGSDSLRFRRSTDALFLDGPGGGVKIAGELSVPWETLINTLAFYLTNQGENVTVLPCSWESQPHHVMTAWHDSTIYAAGDYQPWRYEVDSQFNVIHDGMSIAGAYFNIEVNQAGTKVAFSSIKNSSGDPGHILELDLTNGKIDSLSPDSLVSTIRYIGSSDDIIFYSCGSDREHSGYYKLVRATGKSTFLLQHIPDHGFLHELLKGFDVSPDGKKLLIPSSTSDRRMLVLTEYDIETGRLDTLSVSVSLPNWYNTIWTQYNRDGTKILYAVTDFGRGPSFVGGPTTAGIIDRATLGSTPVFLSPTNERPFCAPYPRWSPDDKAICYGGCVIPVDVLDYIGPFYVYIKKL